MSIFSLIPYAQAATTDTAAFAKVINPIIDNIVSPLLMLAFAVTIIVFIWGIAEMLMHGDDAGARETGRNHMLAGVIGLVIMTSAWGIIYFISDTIAIDLFQKKYFHLH